MAGRGWKRVDVETANYGGLYAICEGRRVVYIGQSSMLSRRLAAHAYFRATSRDVRWVKACVVEDRGEREVAEERLIRRLCPPLNLALNARRRQQHDDPETSRFAAEVTKQQALRIDPALWRRARMKAIMDGHSMNTVVQELLMMWLDE